MASTYVNNLRLNEMATGDGSGTWGTTTNTNLELIGQALGYGTRAIANASTDNITIADGASDADRAMYLKLTGGGQACTVTLLPNTASKVWMMENATSYTLAFTCGSGANVSILAGETKIIATDGGGSGGIVYDVLTDTNLAGTTKTAALTNAGALSNQGTVTVGVNDTGYDVKLFGATSGAYMLWDESADDLKLVGAAGLTVAADIDVDGTANLDVVDIDGAVDMATTLAVAGNVDFNGDLDVDGTTNLDVVDIDGAVNMATTALVTGVLTTTATQVATGGITSGSTIISDTDSTDSLGSTGVRWLKGWFDTLTAGTLTIGSGSITDSSGAISFGDIDLTNVGTIYADQYLGDADANSGIVLPGSDVMTLNTAGSERMRILAGGNVFIGDDSFGGSGATLAVQVPAAAAGGEGCVIRVGSTADAAETLWQFIDGADQGIGAITGNPSSNTTAYGTSSDYRLKENVSYTWDATTRLKQLKPARFNWIKQGASTVHDGFLAHEVSAIVPSAIIGAKDAVDENDDPKYQQIDQAKLVPLLVKTIQELEARITALES